MPRGKKTDADTELTDMFAELENAREEPTSGPEAVNQPQLGGKPQKLKPEMVAADLEGGKAPKPKAKAPVTDLSEGTDPAASVGELDFHTVTIIDKNIRFIPGQKKFRMRVLREWCEENCKGGWKPMKNGLTWFFDLEEDASAFNESWNSRELPDQEPDVTDGMFYEV